LSTKIINRLEAFEKLINALVLFRDFENAMDQSRLKKVHSFLNNCTDPKFREALPSGAKSYLDEIQVAISHLLESLKPFLEITDHELLVGIFEIQYLQDFHHELQSFAQEYEKLYRLMDAVSYDTDWDPEAEHRITFNITRSLVNERVPFAQLHQRIKTYLTIRKKAFPGIDSQYTLLNRSTGVDVQFIVTGSVDNMEDHHEYIMGLIDRMRDQEAGLGDYINNVPPTLTAPSRRTDLCQTLTWAPARLGLCQLSISEDAPTRRAQAKRVFTYLQSITPKATNVTSCRFLLSYAQGCIEFVTINKEAFLVVLETLTEALAKGSAAHTALSGLYKRLTDFKTMAITQEFHDDAVDLISNDLVKAQLENFLNNQLASIPPIDTRDWPALSQADETASKKRAEDAATTAANEMQLTPLTRGLVITHMDYFGPQTYTRDADIAKNPLGTAAATVRAHRQPTPNPALALIQSYQKARENGNGGAMLTIFKNCSEGRQATLPALVQFNLNRIATKILSEIDNGHWDIDWMFEHLISQPCVIEFDNYIETMRIKLTNHDARNTHSHTGSGAASAVGHGLFAGAGGIAGPDDAAGAGAPPPPSPS
jgi:hypothetical protein